MNNIREDFSKGLREANKNQFICNVFIRELINIGNAEAF